MYKLFIIALFLRLSMFVLFSILYDNPTHKESDAKAHYETSINLEVPKESQKTIGYHDWWERSPVYVIYLYVTKQSILLQIILSCLTVLILYKINPLAGWLFCFYPQSIILSFQFNKETLLFFVEAILFLIIYRRYKNEQR